MRTGERGRSASAGGAVRGFTYLAVLFLAAITAAALAALGQSWSSAAQRERERELEFRGRAIAAAIASYKRAAVTPSAQWPQSLDDLLLDQRGIQPRHHLRQRYLDPFTGEANWVLLPDPADASRFTGVRSRSDQPLLRERSAGGAVVRRASDWVFVAPPLGARPGKPSGSLPPPMSVPTPGSSGPAQTKRSEPLMRVPG